MLLVTDACRWLVDRPRRQRGRYRPLRSPYPHHSWLAHWIRIAPPRVFTLHDVVPRAHQLILTTGGQARVASRAGRLETTAEWTCGSLALFPCGDRPHHLSIRSIDGLMAYSLIIPRWQLGVDRAVEGEPMRRGVQAPLAFRDTLLEVSLTRLATSSTGCPVSEDLGDEAAARTILRRLRERAGDAVPNWHTGGSVFTPAVMRQLVTCIDDQLRIPLSCETLADTVQLSPGHFARKFWYSAGVSLSRFINVRRVRASFALLLREGGSLAGIALDLGFCSQSHYTRQFSCLTGMSPGRFRRLQANVGD